MLGLGGLGRELAGVGEKRIKSIDISYEAHYDIFQDYLGN